MFHVEGADGKVEQVVYDEGTGAEVVEYQVHDALGSAGVVFGQNGAVIERMFNEPFGGRINADGSSFVAAPKNTLDGFTGHEMEHGLGLINMRGRMYDPVIRRFLTPDPVVADPLFGQSYNRYAYALNNPLRYVDPSGYQPVSWWPDTAGCGMPPPTGGIGVTVRFDVTGIGRRPPAGGGKPGLELDEQRAVRHDSRGPCGEGVRAGETRDRTVPGAGQTHL